VLEALLEITLSNESTMALLVHYVIIRRDLTLGEYSAQLAHAGEAYALRRDQEQQAIGQSPSLGAERHPQIMQFNMTTCIVKGARNEAKLLKLEKQLIAVSVPHVAIREETGPGGRRLAGQLTCISLMPSSDPALRDLLNNFQEIKALDGADSSSEEKSAWLRRQQGNEYNAEETLHEVLCFLDLFRTIDRDDFATVLSRLRVKTSIPGSSKAEQADVLPSVDAGAGSNPAPGATSPE